MQKKEVESFSIFINTQNEKKEKSYTWMQEDKINLFQLNRKNKKQTKERKATANKRPVIYVNWSENN